MARYLYFSECNNYTADIIFDEERQQHALESFTLPRYEHVDNISNPRVPQTFIVKLEKPVVISGEDKSKVTIGDPVIIKVFKRISEYV